MTKDVEAIKRDMRDMMQDTGDAIADVFNQMIKGNWKDDHDHDVRMNRAMCRLKDVLAAMIEYRKSNPWTLTCRDAQREEGTW